MDIILFLGAICALAVFVGCFVDINVARLFGGALNRHRESLVLFNWNWNTLFGPTAALILLFGGIGTSELAALTSEEDADGCVVLVDDLSFVADDCVEAVLQMTIVCRAALLVVAVPDPIPLIDEILAATACALATRKAANACTEPSQD